MRFLVAFAAVLGYASAGLIDPLVFGTNAGDMEAAIINADVAAQDHARALERKQALAAEDRLRAKNKAIRDAADISQHFRENAYWDSMVASQNYEAAVQSRAAAMSGTAAAVRAAAAARASQFATPVFAAVAPFAYAGYRLPTAYGLGLQGL